jgi:hypothetical protein
MTTSANPSGGDLMRRITEAAVGLVYSSESDRPFVPFSLPASAAPPWPPEPRAFARMVGAQGGDPVVEQSLDAFFRRHIELVEPADEAAWRLLPRYDALKRLLETELSDVRVFRIGRVQVHCFIVGRDVDCHILGLTTVAIET